MLKQNRARRMISRVDIDDPNEVKYVHHQLPDRQHCRIVDAIKVAGLYREKKLTLFVRESITSFPYVISSQLRQTILHHYLRRI